MDAEQIIEEAIRLFHQETRDSLPDIGAIIAHTSDPYAYYAREIDVQNEIITGFFEQDGVEHVKTFPLYEVFNPGAVKMIAVRLKLNQSARSN